MGHEERVKQVLQKADQPMSTNAVAQAAGLDWHATDNVLNKMEEKGEVHRERLNTQMKLWWDREIPI